MYKNEPIINQNMYLLEIRLKKRSKPFQNQTIGDIERIDRYILENFDDSKLVSKLNLDDDSVILT